MNKTLIGLLLFVTVGVGTAYADQATVDAIQNSGVVLTDAQVTELAAATGDDLVSAIASLVASAANDDTASAIMLAAISVNPSLKGKIISLVATTSPQVVASIFSKTPGPTIGQNIGNSPAPSNNNNASPSS